jgi:hypothetical protein
MTSPVLQAALSLAFFSLSVFVTGLSPAPTQPEFPKAWGLSDGYRLLVEFGDVGLRTYEITSISSIPSQSAKRADNVSSGAIVLTSGQQTISISPGDGSSLLRLHTDGTASTLVLHRTSKRPDSCQATLLQRITRFSVKPLLSSARSSRCTRLIGTPPTRTFGFRLAQTPSQMTCSRFFER